MKIDKGTLWNILEKYDCVEYKDLCDSLSNIIKDKSTGEDDTNTEEPDTNEEVGWAKWKGRTIKKIYTDGSYKEEKTLKTLLLGGIG